MITGASVRAATSPRRMKRLSWRDERIRPWILAGVASGHAQAATLTCIGFFIIDQLSLAPIGSEGPISIVMIAGAAATLAAQWGIIPRLDISPRNLILWGCAIACGGVLITMAADDLYGLVLGFGVTSIGFGFTRPGFTAGSSLAVGPAAQGSVAGKVTSVNGASFVLGPSIGVGLYEIARPLPYLTAAGALVLLLGYAWATLRERG